MSVEESTELYLTPARRSVGRAVIAAFTVVAALLTALVSAAPAQASWSFQNSLIAAKAQSYAIGSHGGQCRVFAGNVVNAVLASQGISKRITGYYSGGDYYQAYINGGGTLIAVNDVSAAQPGDLIQTINANQVNLDFPTTKGLHTAIVVRRTGTPGTVVVRDSNFGTPELVSEHEWAPIPHASSVGANTYLWRFGAIDWRLQFANSIVQWSNGAGKPNTSWYVSADLKRYWIPSTAIYWCLRNRGVRDFGVQSAGVLNALPDQNGQWATCTAYKDSIGVNERLVRGQSLRSSDGRYTLWMQSTDGNVVAYNSAGRAIWATNRGGDFLVLQSDGNLVEYTNAGVAVWASNTVGRGGTRLYMQSDGNIVMYRADGRAVWASNTAGR